MSRSLVISTDAYADASSAGWAFVVEGDITLERSGALPVIPSHLAEWRAVEHALGWAEAEAAEGDSIVLRTDSALVEKGLASRRPEMSGEAALVRAACRQALARLGERGVRVRVERVRREENARADGLAREAAHDAQR